MKIYSHELKLETQDNFSKAYNKCTDLYLLSQDDSLDEKINKKLF